ncbi:MAG: hypothetical protein RIQ60_3487 [Pseudomonadota bacterium]
MRYRKFGRTGLDVSCLCLGCMSFGEPGRGGHPWTLDEAASRPILHRALDAGINFFDTANVYSDGSSEEILGRVLLGAVPRDDLVIATKVYGSPRSDPNQRGLSRKAILREVDASLKRLGTDYIDLYQIHRWDPGTPIEETLQALDDLVRSGKVRYLGASSMWAWQFAKALHTSERQGLHRFVSMQDQVSLLYREEEREMLPLCTDAGTAVMAWSPLARGRLTRAPEVRTARLDTDNYGKSLFEASEPADRRVIEAVAAVAADLDRPMAQVALSWVLDHPGVTVPIVGATRVEQLNDALAALDLRLGVDQRRALEEPYVPHAVVGFE